METDKTRVVIIGAKGMLGQSLVEIFESDEKYKTIGWDIEDIDIADREKVFGKIKEARPQAVINCAAYNMVDKAEESGEEFKKANKINGDGPGYLARVCQKEKAVFVHYVSDYVFDGKKGAYEEGDETNPISKYGLSKELGEKKVKEIGGAYYLIRTSKLFGRPAKAKTSKKSFFDVMLDLAKEKKELKVVDDERSCFTYVDDLAKATKKLIDENFEYGIYHIANEGPATWYEGVLKLFEIAGVKNVKVIPVSSEEFPRPAKRPKSSILINTKFPKLRRYEKAIEEWINIYH
jgi:dTDP-4-dehydrorhamnose reductase